MDALFRAHAYGIPEALPADGETLSTARVDTLSAQARVVLAVIAKRLAAGRRVARAGRRSAAGRPSRRRTLETARRIKVALERASDAARELFGSAFVIVPLFRFHQPAQAAELQLAAAAPPVADALEIEEWLHSVARVRPRSPT